MANLDALKDYFTPETFAQMEKEFEAYTESHSEEKVRFENVSTGQYVSAKKLASANKDIERLNGEIETLKATISTNDTDAAAQVEKLKQQIDEMNAQNSERDAEARLNERFASAKGTNEFINSFTENGVKAAFRAALEMPQNSGKSDADIYAAVVADLGEVYKNPHKPNDMIPMGEVDSKLDAEAFKGMSLDEQMKFANTHSEQYKRLFKE